MAVISLTIPDAVVPRVMAAFASQFGYQEEIINPNDPTGPLIANPQTKAAFAKAQLVGIVVEIVKTHEAIAAAEAASLAAKSDVDSQVVIN